jgi:hypothetical protein
MEENDLDKIFNEYQEKIRLNHDMNHRNESKQNELKIKAKKLFDVSVIPLFEKTKTQLAERGHSSSVYVRPDSFLYPSTTLSFKPNVKNTTNVSQTESSTLTYNLNLTGSIDVKLVIKGIKRLNDDSYTQEYSDTYDFQKVSEVVVESSIQRLIKLTMDVY